MHKKLGTLHDIDRHDESSRLGVHISCKPFMMPIPKLISDAVTRNILSNVRTNSNRYSPQVILKQLDPSSLLSVKRSTERFFMYEEGIQDIPTITVPPNELATLLSYNRSSNDHHYYWTQPISAMQTTNNNVLNEEFKWYKQLHKDTDEALLDPRGPSLWMVSIYIMITSYAHIICSLHHINIIQGTSNSGTQCHYDVANNIIVQLHGTKRIRCYPPSMGVYNLHVFPDNHPKARKSQVDFDYDVSKHSNSDDMINRFPHYYQNIPKPTLDVTLQPGDALQIPAFWFHHVENGYSNNNMNGEGSHKTPSVSLNSFSLSKPMMIAQQIFQRSSNPMGRRIDKVQVPSILRALGVTLLQKLDIDDITTGREVDFIRAYLLEARYDPLITIGDYDTTSKQVQHTLTNEQIQAINTCIDKIIPNFHLLIKGEVEGDNQDGTGIALLVALHLFELWAVEFVGTKSVVKAWDEALLSDDGTFLT